MRALAIALIALTSGCAYYNAMWRAERFAKDARQLEARGQEVEARAFWARAAVKAESVVARHPRSRWADDALVLQGEGLSRAGACNAAAAPIAKARSTVTDPALRERAGLAGAQCAIAARQPVQAEEALTEALESQDGARRSRAEYLAGQAAALRLDYDGAVEHFRRSREPGALPARARALLAAGRVNDAVAVIDTLASAPLRETERAELLATLAGAESGGAVDAASAALDRQLARTRLPFGEQARLLIADGDRQLVAGDHDAATARYRQAAAVAPIATSEAGTARVREQRALVARATAPDDLAPIMAELRRLAVGEGTAAPGAQRLLDLVTQATAPQGTPGFRFRGAELVRDSLSAPALAGRLFLDAAAADSASLYAPKALLAALPLLPAQRDSIVAVLDTRYGASPYTRAFHGEASVAYAAAEDSLARALGVQLARPSRTAGARIDVPLTGPRGPWLDDPPRLPAPAARSERPAPPPPPVRNRPTQADRP